MGKKIYSGILLIFLCSISFKCLPATFYSKANGNWNNAATWSTVSCTGATATSIPGPADNVIICSGRTVTMNGSPGSCLSLTINGTATWSSAFTTNVGTGGVILNNGAVLSGTAIGILNSSSLTVSSGASTTVGGITLNISGSTTISGTLSFNNTGGTKTFTNVIINSTGTFSSSVAETYSVNGNLTMNGGTISGSNTGDITVSGSFTVSAGTNATVGRLNLSINGITNINGTLTDNNISGSKVFATVNINSGGSFFSSVNETYNINGNLNLTAGSVTGTSTGRFVVSGDFNVLAGTSNYGDAWLTVTGTSTISGTINWLNNTGNKKLANVTIASTGVFNNAIGESFQVSGNFLNNGSFISGASTYTFTGTNKTFGGTSATTINNINITGSYTNNLNLTIPTSLIGTGSFSQGASGILNYSSTNANLSITTFNASVSGNLVNYSSSGAFNIPIPTDGKYYHLTVSGGATKAQIASTIISGNFLISSGTIYNTGNFALSVGGNFTNNNSFIAGTSTVTLNGTALQTIGGGVITPFKNLTVSNAAGALLAINTSISGILNFTSGIITTGTFKVTITSTGSVTGAGTSRFVNGYLEKNVATGTNVSRVYEIGNGTTQYLPLNVVFASVSATGNITASVSNTDHPGITSSCIDETKSVNHYWTLSNSGTSFTTYSATCNFIGVGTDADAGSVTSNYYMSVYNAGAWTLLTPGSGTSTSTQSTGISVIGDLQAGERRTPTIPVQPISTTVCNNSSAVFSLTVSGIGLSYQWQENTGSGFVNITNGGIYSGATSSTLTINPVTTAMNNYQYQCVIANTCGTAIVTSNSCVLNVTPNVTASNSISVSPSSIICAGTNVTFTSTALNGGTTPVYQWQVNGVNAGVNSSGFSSSGLNNNDIVTCILTSNANCVIGSPATSNSISMTVNPVLPVSVSISATSTSICPGTNVDFTATPTNGGTTPSYQWKLNGSNVGSNSAIYSSSALANGDIITCVLTSNAVCPSGTPATSNSITITVNPSLPVSVSISESPSNIICSGTNVIFTATPVNGGTTPTYQWQLNGGNVGSNSATYSNSTLSNGDIISCILTSSASCSTGSPAISNNITMTVNTNLPVSVSISATATVICSGTNVDFTASPVNGGVTPSYQWKLNGGNVGTNAAIYSSSSLTNGDIVSCVLTSSETCGTGNPATSNSVTMTVNTGSPASVSIAESPSNNICSGTNVTFTATPVNGGAAPVYQWLLNGSNVGSNSTTYSNSGLINGDAVSCIMTSNALCATNNPATSGSVTMVVNPSLPVSISISSSSGSFVCSGSTVTFTATTTNGGTSPFYQWKLNGGNVGTNAGTYVNSTLNNGDVISCVLTSNVVCPIGNPATSNSITESVVNSGTWIGSVSGDWSNASNWCGAVPLITSNITIPSGTTFSPILSTSSNCRNIALSAGSVLDLNGQTLNVYGAFSGTGTLKGSLTSSLNIAAGAGSGGTFRMDQSVPGISNNLSQLTLNRAGSSAILGNALNVTNTITVTAGTLSTGSNLTLVSTASGTARVASLVTGADITGNVTMQRYIPGGTDGWMFLCAPVSGATLAQWDDDFVTGGFPGSQYPASPNPSIAGYDETYPGIYDDGYTTPSGITDAIAPREGYWAYIMGTPLTVDVTGPLLKNAQTFSVTYTDDPLQFASEEGWNLLANPYPSTIDWDGPGWTKTNINDAIYMYSADLDQYTSYVGGIGTNGGSNLIASSQAFLVQADSVGTPVLKLTESVKSASDGAFLRTPVIGDLLKFNLSGNGYTDETYIRFDSSSTVNFDNGRDAKKFFSYNSNVPGMATINNSINYSINSVPLNGSISIPLLVRVGVSGTYILNVDSLSSLPENVCIYLDDFETGDHINLRTQETYSFYIYDTTFSPRFRINIGEPVNISSVTPSCSNSLDGSIIAIGTGSGPLDYLWLNPAGDTIQNHLNITGADSLLNISGGVYTVIISGNTGSCSSVANEVIDIQEPDPMTAYVNITNENCPGTSDGMIDMLAINEGVGPFNYLWSNGVITEDNMNIPSGSYSLSVTDNTGCVKYFDYTVGQEPGALALFVMSADTVYLDNNMPVLFTNNSTGANSFIWDFGDGSPSDNSSDPVHLYTTAGTYIVELIVSNGACNDTVLQEIVVMPLMATGIDSDNSINNVVTVLSEGNSIGLLFDFNKEADANIELYNSIGQKIIIDKEEKVFKNKIELDITGKSKGVYYVKISSEYGTIVKKIIKS
jgi:hypothetical protein